MFCFSAVPRTDGIILWMQFEKLKAREAIGNGCNDGVFNFEFGILNYTLQFQALSLYLQYEKKL